MVDVVSRASWGAQPWRPKVEMYTVPVASRTEFFTHYHGGPPAHDRGVAMAREIEAIHLANGWAGVGYSWMVGQDGVAYEGRGWDLVGAHCPGHNRSGLAAYVAVGGDQVPTAAALHTVRALYDEACHRSGRQLQETWHGAHHATECPGARLIAWVRAGMQDPTHPDDPRETVMPADLTPAAVQSTARAVADIMTGDKPIDEGGAYYRVHDVDEQGHPVLRVPTAAQAETLRLLRSIDGKLDQLLKGGQ